MVLCGWLCFDRPRCEAFRCSFGNCRIYWLVGSCRIISKYSCALRVLSLVAMAFTS